MTITQKKIHPADLIPMNLCAAYVPLQIHLAYAKDASPNIFGRIYHEHAQLWLHRDLAKIVCLSAAIVHLKYGYNLVLYDGLRTVEAQSKMAESGIVKANPHWMEEPRLLSPPGAGAHPRGMAIDMSLLDKGGCLVDMGTEFDYLAADQGADHNPAHRSYTRLETAHKKNRDMLNEAVCKAAFDLDYDLDFLAQEWWDFRFKKEYYEQFSPLSDDDLPPEMRMVNTAACENFKEIYAPRAEEIIAEMKDLADIASVITAP
ncbi:MAG: M15 family metallopeptidase [Alphaproteobacteria bacterium]